VLIIRYWDLIKSAAAAAVDWIRSHWQLLLFFLTGPIGVAVGIIARYWSTITAAAGAAVNWIRGAWNGLVGFLVGIPGRIGGALASMFNAALGAAGRIIGGIQSAWNGAVGWISGIPGRIVAALGNLGNLLFNAGQNVIGGLVNGIKSKIPDVGGAISSVASAITSHLPFSPAKQGPLSGRGDPYYSGIAIGRQLARGLAASHSMVQGATRQNLPNLTVVGGTASTAPVNQGPAVVINSASFNEQVDVDLFMSRVAWHAQKQAV
jgi:phage-related protein